MFKNFAHDFIGRRFHGKSEGFARLLEVGKLSRENRGSGEVAAALAQALADENGQAFEVDNFDGEIFREALTVGLLERGAGEDHILPFRVQGHEAGMDCSEPRKTVGVRQRNAAAHFGDVFGGVKLVGFEKHPSQPLGQKFADGAFAGAGDSHEEKDHSLVRKSGGPSVAHSAGQVQQSFVKWDTLPAIL